MKNTTTTTSAQPSPRLYWSEQGEVACTEHMPHRGSDTFVWGRWRPIRPAEHDRRYTFLLVLRAFLLPALLACLPAAFAATALPSPVMEQVPSSCPSPRSLPPAISFRDRQLQLAGRPLERAPDLLEPLARIRADVGLDQLGGLSHRLGRAAPTAAARGLGGLGRPGPGSVGVSQRPSWAVQGHHVEDRSARLHNRASQNRPAGSRSPSPWTSTPAAPQPPITNSRALVRFVFSGGANPGSRLQCTHWVASTVSGQVMTILRSQALPGAIRVQ
jgi:hypothetical protein